MNSCLLAATGTMPSDATVNFALHKLDQLYYGHYIEGTLNPLMSGRPRNSLVAKKL